MANLTKIKLKNDLKVGKQILNYLNPDYIYLPYDESYRLNIKSEDIVYKEDVILSKDENHIYSPVSGKVLGACNMQVGKIKCRCVVIENDFKEKTRSIKGAKKHLNNYTKTDVLTLLKLYNAYDGKLKGETLIINGIDLEPYVATKSYLISKYTVEILETIDALCNILDINKCLFAIKNNDSENVDELVNHIGTYPNIDLKLMPDLYPLGNNDILLKELIIPRKLDSEVIILSTEEVYAIYNVLKRARPITEKLITVSGSALTKQKVVNVKIGSSIRDIIMNNFKIKTEDYRIIINGLMSGYEIDNLDFIITSDIRSIFIELAIETFEKSCINCGMCHTKCPVSCDPRNNYKMENCINCGICSFICPAKINFKERIRK